MPRGTGGTPDRAWREYDAQPMDSLERYIDLVVLLLEAPRPLTFEEIRRRMPEAYAQGNLESAKRMFERDKDALRGYGVPIELEIVDQLEQTEGYRIQRDRYYLPPISFTPEEISALWVTSATTENDDPARLAVRKLIAGSGGRGLPVAGPIQVAAGPGSELVRSLATSTLGRRAVGFRYRDARNAESRREVDPYGLVARAGQWYLVGHDRARDAIRAFRISRILGEAEEIGEAAGAPPGFHAADHITVAPPGSDELRRTTVAVHPDLHPIALASFPGAADGQQMSGGWPTVSVPVSDPAWTASWVLSFGERARVVEDGPVRDEVLRRLEAWDG